MVLALITTACSCHHCHATSSNDSVHMSLDRLTPFIAHQDYSRLQSLRTSTSKPSLTKALQNADVYVAIVQLTILKA
eukprot:6322592-Amphidinium_carterae.2